VPVSGVGVAGQLIPITAGFMRPFPTGGGGAFDPTTMSWRNLWWAEGAKFKALGLTDGAAVGSWPDETASANWTQATAGFKPLYRAAYANLNGKPGVRPDGVDDYMSQTMVYQARPYSMVIVSTAENAWLNHAVFAQDAPGASFYNVNGNRLPGISQGGTALNGVTYGTPYNVGRLFVGYWNVQGTGTSQIQIDNQPAMLTTGNTDWTQSSDGISGANAYLFTGSQSGAPRASYYMNEGLALFGIAAGDIRTDPKWSQFVAWVKTYYGVPAP